MAKKIFQVKTQYAIELMCISNFVFLVQIERAIMRKNKYMIVVSAIIAVAVIVATAVIGKNVYAKSLQKNVDIYISSVSLVKNPDNPNDEEVFGLLKQYFNQTVRDICVYYDIHDTDKEFSEAEKSMKFDLSKFNIYKIKIACDKKNAAKNKFVFARITDFCQESKYMYVPCNVSSDICAENTLYYFVSKEYSEEDVKQYLKNTGSSIYVCIGKDELRPIVNYDKTIFYEPEKRIS